MTPGGTFVTSPCLWMNSQGHTGCGIPAIPNPHPCCHPRVTSEWEGT